VSGASLMLLEVALLGFNPAGFPAISRWSPRGAPPVRPRKRCHIPAGCQPFVLASRRDVIASENTNRWCRCAQPPANCSKPFRVEQQIQQLQNERFGFVWIVVMHRAILRILPAMHLSFVIGNSSLVSAHLRIRRFSARMRGSGGIRPGRVIQRFFESSCRLLSNT
jgi:hypothetical protein